MADGYDGEVQVENTVTAAGGHEVLVIEAGGGVRCAGNDIAFPFTDRSRQRIADDVFDRKGKVDDTVTADVVGKGIGVVTRLPVGRGAHRVGLAGTNPAGNVIDDRADDIQVQRNGAVTSIGGREHIGIGAGCIVGGSADLVRLPQADFFIEGGLRVVQHPQVEDDGTVAAVGCHQHDLIGSHDAEVHTAHGKGTAVTYLFIECSDDGIFHIQVEEDRAVATTERLQQYFVGAALGKGGIAYGVGIAEANIRIDGSLHIRIY